MQISTKTLMHTIKTHFLCHYAKKHLHELIVSHMCPKFFQTGSVCTYITRYKVFGIVWSLSAWLNGTILMR